MTTTTPAVGDLVRILVSATVVQLRTVGGIPGAVVELTPAVIDRDGQVQQDPVRVFIDLQDVDRVIS